VLFEGLPRQLRTMPERPLNYEVVFVVLIHSRLFGHYLADHPLTVSKSFDTVLYKSHDCY